MISQNCPEYGIWCILKYYEPLLLQNTTYRSCYFFVYNGSREIFGEAQETSISLRLKTQTQYTFVIIFFTLMKKEITDSFFFFFFFFFFFVKPAQTVEGTQHEKV